MTDPTPIEACNASRVTRLRPLAKVALIWTILAVIFAAFNLVYWPVYRRQALEQPESFLAYADTLRDDAARRVLQQGIARFNPPLETPYARLAELEARAGNTAAAERHKTRASFYRALNQGTAKNDLSELTRSISEAYVAVPSTAAKAVGVAAASFCEALRIGDLTDQWTLPQQIALFALGGGTLSLDGTIGASLVKAPVSLLVYSGGGIDERRGAHIFVGDTDHASVQRGMHIVLLDAETGAVIRADLFDLWDSVDEAERMPVFLNNAPDGCIGLFAVCDEGSAFMTNAIEAGLMRFGIEKGAVVEGEPRILGLRYSFAAIGVKGAPAGSAMQAWSPDRFHGHRGHPVVCAVFPTGDRP